MVLLSYFFASSIVERHISQNAEGMTATAEEKLQARLQSAQASIVQTAISVEGRLEIGQTPGQIEDYFFTIRNRLAENLEILNGFIDFYGFVSGEFVSGTLWRPGESYIPQERPWYIAAMEQPGKPSFTGPYIDAHTGVMVVSASVTLLDRDEKILGVIAVDVRLYEIADYVSSLQFSRGGYGLLVDQNLTVVAHPNKLLEGQSLESLGGDHVGLMEKMRESPDSISMYSMRNSDGVRVIAFYRKMFNGWYIGISTPRSSYFRDVYIMACVLSVIGFFMMVILCFFLIRLNIAKSRSDEENKAKASFLSKISHEIRTPIHSIMGISEIILRKDISEEVYEYVSIIKHAGDKLLSSINDILDFSRIESGQVSVASRKYQIASLINDAVNVVCLRMADKRIDFFVNMGRAIPAELFGDDDRIRQILNNLLDNAVKYTQKGYIALGIRGERLERGRLKLIFAIEDTGIGILPGDIENLFREFLRVDVRGNKIGARQGLSIANSFCRDMGGAITVESEYGKGSIFTASVIQTFEDDRPAAQVSAPEAKRVLAFEERPYHAASLTGAFRSIGIDLAYAKDPGELQQALAGKGYDYVFVPSKYAADCISSLGDGDPSTPLVIMTEPGDSISYRNRGTIRLPIYSCTLANFLNEVESSPAHHDRRPGFSAPGARVLIVDDISTNIRVAAELMAPYGMQIDSCFSGGEALELVQKNRYDLVFMDHMMPGMDGITATARIRSLHRKGDTYYQELPVIIFTANAIFGQKELFLKNGLNDFLAKPIDVQKLDEILRNWIPKEKQVEGALPVTDDRSTKTELKAIAGVDLKRGIDNTGGSTEAYKTILAIFCADVKERLPLLRETAGAGDLSAYITAVHALKGASRSIGARETGDMAAELEEAGKAGNREFIDGKTDPFLDHLEGLVSRITASLKEESSPTGGTVPADLELGVLREALITMDTACVNSQLQKYAEMSLDDKTKQFITEIENCVLLFEYEKAVELIDSLGKGDR
ncbi:response regulator [Treponema primitia]|uniref:hybrid sensor histidine kinase/response regulator n=1 Tax=Treponema primitia TaxID=88058 RepID=UPI003980CC6E